MSSRLYLFVVGVSILSALYFEIDIMIYSVAAWLLFEGLTEIRLTRLFQKFSNQTVPEDLYVTQSSYRFNFGAFRAWRFAMAFMLGGSFFLWNVYDIEIVWFIPWFMGFAIMGAGISGVCPVLLLMRWAGFK